MDAVFERLHFLAQAQGLGLVLDRNGDVWAMGRENEPGSLARIAVNNNDAVKVYLDVIDSAYAPGVSAMNPAGWSARQAEAAAYAAGKCARVRCFDIMELSPPNDHGDRTARLAAHLFLCFLRGFAERSA